MSSKVQRQDDEKNRMVTVSISWEAREVAAKCKVLCEGSTRRAVTLGEVVALALDHFFEALKKGGVTIE